MGFTSIKKISQTFDDIIKDENFFVVVKMSDVTSISSPVIGELMGCRMSLLNNNGDLVLAGLRMEILETLNALDADKIFKIFVDIIFFSSFENLSHKNYTAHDF